MRIISATQAKDLDIKAKEKFGMPTLLLMENAAGAVVREALKVPAGRKGKIAVFCGKGNNGGDGFCAARQLLAVGIRPDVFLAGKITDVKNEARVNLEILLKLKQKITEVDERNLSLLNKKISIYSLIIDALLGVGLKGQVKGIYRGLIGILNSSKAYILSVDIPSGLCATTGRVLGTAIKADKTVTFIARKAGMISAAGRHYCGEIVVAGLGIPL